MGFSGVQLFEEPIQKRSSGPEHWPTYRAVTVLRSKGFCVQRRGRDSHFRAHLPRPSVPGARSHNEATDGAG